MNFPEDNTDRELLGRWVLHRDEQAFAAIVRRHYKWLVTVAAGMSGGQHDAEEITQACFAALSRHAAMVHRSLRGWLVIVARRYAWKLINRSSLRRRAEQEFAIGKSKYISPPLPSHGIMHEMIERLPHPTRRLLTLRFYEGMSFSEIGQRVDMKPRLVARRVEQGISQLRVILTHERPGM